MMMKKNQESKELKLVTEWKGDGGLNLQFFQEMANTNKTQMN